MAHNDRAKSVVKLFCYDKNDRDSGEKTSTGFVSKRISDGLFITSTCHQLNAVFSKSKTLQKVSKDTMGVRVVFYDQVTVLDAAVVHFDEINDLAMFFILVDPLRLRSEPLCFAQPIELSNEELFPRQDAYTIHHPVMILRNGQISALNGFIVDPNLESSGVVHFHMPLVMPGSSGSPIIDKNSNKLLCVLKGFDSGYLISPEDKEHRLIQDTVERWYGVSVSTINQFYQEVTAIISSV